jgi:NAD(P)-dependent dehydrogenase (short-subunit alcohol dehydrogenase family)
MGSTLAEHPQPDHFAAHAYAAAKGAINSMTLSMAAYYAAKKIRVNVIAPGLVKTPMSHRAQENPEILDFVQHRLQRLAGGILETDDIARAALFLLSDESRHLTGQVITIDGGWSVS